MKENREHPATRSPKYTRIASFTLLAAAFFSLTLSPRFLSGDSIEYLYKAVVGSGAFHPHHPVFSPILRAAVILGDKLGFDEARYGVLRAVMLLFSWVGVWATYRFLRFLSFSRIVSSLSSLLVSVSGLYWQFSTQFEAYVPAYAILALSACTVLSTARALNRSGKALSSSVILRFILSCLLLAVATALHQACSLTAPAVGLLLFLSLNRDRKSLDRVLISILYCGVSGLFSVLIYLSGWLISKPGHAFLHWLTEYAHWDGMPWGLASNFSVQGIRYLRLSWLASWINLFPQKFADPLPDKYGGISTVVLIAAGAASLYLVFSTLRGVRRAGHIWWIILWIVPVEIFVLWWTPFLKNFQAFVLLPQVTLVALFFDVVFEGRSHRRRIFRRLPCVLEGVLALLLFVVNFTHLAVPGFKDRLAPEGDLILARPFLREGDVFVLEWPHHRMMSALFSFKNVYRFFEMNKNCYPDWKSNPSSSGERMVFHHSSLFLNELQLARNNAKYEDVWTRSLENLELAAGGFERLRGMVITNRNELLLAVFGVDQALPMSYGQVLNRIAILAEDAPGNVHTGIADVMLSRIPIEERTRNIRALRDEAIKRGYIPEVLDLSFVGPGGKPLWNKGIDTDRIELEKNSIKAHNSGRDPVLWRPFSKPRGLFLYSHITIIASIRPVDGEKQETIFQIFFQYENEGISQTRSVIIPWIADGKLHEKTVNLWKKPFFTKKRNVIGIRVDPGDLPDSDIIIRKISFHSGGDP